MWLTPMQAAFIKAAPTAPSKLAARVVRVAERIQVRDPKNNVKLSFRTAQKLKSEGVIE